MKKLKCLDLFSGIGGFRLSFENSCKEKGITSECIGFSEIDRFAIKTYKANFKTEDKDLGDITKINFSNLDDFDFLFAGFPCQPFSMMGKQKGFSDTRGTMFFSIEKIIENKRPRFFILENVRRLLTHDGGKTYNKIIEILEKKLKYKTKTLVLNSSDYGTPQIRRRIYILGFRDEENFHNFSEPMPQAPKKYPSTWHVLEKEVEEKYYLSDKLLKTILSNGSGNFKSKSEINKIIARPLTATMHKLHRACQDNYFSDQYIYGKWDSEKNNVVLNKRKFNRIRRLTPLEAFRLQGFPDSFVKNAKKEGVSDTQLYRQAGNAITVNVVEKLVNEMLSSINKKILQLEIVSGGQKLFETPNYA